MDQHYSHKFSEQLLSQSIGIQMSSAKYVMQSNVKKAAGYGPRDIGHR